MAAVHLEEAVQNQMVVSLLASLMGAVECRVEDVLVQQLGVAADWLEEVACWHEVVEVASVPAPKTVHSVVAAAETVAVSGPTQLAPPVFV